MRRVTALGFGRLAGVAGCGDALLGYGRDSGEPAESSANYDGGDAVRRQVQGSSHVVYDDATMPLVKIGFNLITGP